MAVAGHWIGAGGRFNHDVRPDYFRGDVHRRHLADGNAFFVAAKSRGLMRLTRSGPTEIRVGKNKFPLVQRLATKVSVGAFKSTMIMVFQGNTQPRTPPARESTGRRVDEGAGPTRAIPIRVRPFPYPDITDHQDAEENQHLRQAESAEGFEPYRPGKQENGLHIEDHKEYRDNVIGVRYSARVTFQWDRCRTRKASTFLSRIVGTHQLGQQQRQRNPDGGPPK